MQYPFLSPAPVWLAAMLVAGGLASGPARAEKADRSQPLTIEADKPGTVDLQRQVVVFGGNVVISQGTIRVRAERVEVREGADGSRTAVAVGTRDAPATFRQKRDGVDEYVEGSAERIDYDGRGDVVKFTGNAAVRRLRGTTTADEITGHTIVYDNTAEVFTVQGGPSAGSGNGRVKAVLTPRDAPASAPSSTSGARP